MKTEIVFVDEESILPEGELWILLFERLNTIVTKQPVPEALEALGIARKIHSKQFNQNAIIEQIRDSEQSFFEKLCQQKQ